MVEFRASRAVALRPDGRSRRLQPVVHAHVPRGGQLDASALEANPAGVWRLTQRNQQMRTLYYLLRATDHGVECHPVAGPPGDEAHVSRGDDSDPLVLQQLADRLSDVDVLARQEPVVALADTDAAAQPAHGLRELKPHVATAEDQQMLGNGIKFK